MNLDTIRIKMQLENLDFNKSLYNTQMLVSPDGETRTKFVLAKHPLGLNGIELLPETNEAIVSISAKILKEQYLDGVSVNTLGRVHRELKPYINHTLAELEDSCVLRTDITENLYFDTCRDKEFAIQSLKLGKSNTGFKVDDFTDKKESIIFTGRQTSYKNRQIYYNKEKELMLAHNKEIRQCLGKWDKIDKILRVEQNVTSLDKLRQAIGKNKVNTQLVSNFNKSGVNSVKLSEMLTSKQKPLLERHRIIMKYANQVSIFDEYDDWDYAVKIEGWKGLYKRCNSDLDLMIDFLMKTKKAKRIQIWRIKTELQQYFSSENVRKKEEKKPYFEILMKIAEMLTYSKG